MRTKFRILALILALMMLLSACDAVDGTEQDTESSSIEVTTQPPVEESEENSVAADDDSNTEPDHDEYRASISRSREEIEAMLSITDDAFADVQTKLEAFEKIALESSDVDAIDAVYLEFEDAYYYVSTQVSVASIIYYINMSDEAAYERYNTLYDKYGDMHNNYVATCKKVYNESAVRDELFADWTPEEISQMLNYSPESQELALKNDELTNELNNLPSTEFKNGSARIYAELVKNNNRIAELAGYDNYYDYAAKEIYCRDYGREELELFCNTVAEQYIPKYADLYNSLMKRLYRLSEGNYNKLMGFLLEPFDSLDKNYLENYILSLDGTMKEGMEHIFVNKNMVFSDSPKSHPTAFQTYLDDFEMPFCLFGSEGQSTGSLVHEIGHYYASLHAPELSSYDLAEVQSQGNEMLLLNYIGDDMSATLRGSVEEYMLFSNITTLISCAIIDEFEREVYALESVEGYGSEEFDAIMTKVCEKYGGVEFIEQYMGDMYDYWRQVATNNPVYYISYATSLTAALNIYAELQTDRAAGREMYRILVEDVEETDTFLTALEKAGLASPFTQESADKILAIIAK